MARTKPFAKVHLSVADHRRTAAVWGNLAMRGMLVELWRKGVEKFAAKRNDRVPLKPTDRMEIACSTDLREADELVSSLCRALKYRVTRHPNRWEVHIRNLSKKQGFQATELDENFQSTSASETLNAEAETLTAEAEKKKTAPASRSCLCPDSLSDHEAGLASAWAAGKGLTPEQVAYAWERVRDWSKAKTIKRADWLAQLRNGISDGWALKGYGANPTGEPESPALAKERRQREHLREALRRSTAPDSNPPLLALDGGRR